MEWFPGGSADLPGGTAIGQLRLCRSEQRPGEDGWGRSGAALRKCRVCVSGSGRKTAQALRATGERNTENGFPF